MYNVKKIKFDMQFSLISIISKLEINLKKMILRKLNFKEINKPIYSNVYIIILYFYIICEYNIEYILNFDINFTAF